MFEKEAEEYGLQHALWCASESGDLRDAFKEGAEFGFQKGIKTRVNTTTISDCPIKDEWHYVSDEDLPEEDKDGNILVYHTSYGGYCAIGYFKVEDECFKDIDIVAWKEIDLPRRRKNYD